MGMSEDFELIMILASIGIISVFGYLVFNWVLNLTAVEVTEKRQIDRERYGECESHERGLFDDDN